MLRTRARDCLLVCGCGLGLLAKEMLVAWVDFAGVGLSRCKGMAMAGLGWGVAVRIGGCEVLLAIRNGRARCLRRAAQLTSAGGLPIMRYRGGILGNTCFLDLLAIEVLSILG